MQTVDLNNTVPDTQATWLSGEMFAEPTHSFFHFNTLLHIHTYLNMGLGAAQDNHRPLLRATEPMVQFFSQEPLDGCCSGREGREALIQPPSSLGGSNTSVTSAPLSERVTAAKISYVKPNKVSLAVLLK